MKEFFESDISLVRCELTACVKKSHPLIFGADIIEQVNFAKRITFLPSRGLDQIVTLFEVAATGYDEEGNIVSTCKAVYRTKYLIQDLKEYIIFSEDSKSIEVINESLLAFLFQTTSSTVRGKLSSLYQETEFKDFSFPLLNSHEYKSLPSIKMEELVPEWSDDIVATRKKKESSLK